MKAGVSVLELIIGCLMLAVVVYTGAYTLRPISAANKRFRLTNRAHRLEDEIRRGIYYQSNYSNPAGFAIEVAGVVIAQEGETRYVKEDLSASALATDPQFSRELYPLATKIALVQNLTNSQWGLIYQVQSTDNKTIVATLGTPTWPSNASDYFNQTTQVDYSVMNVPAELATSVAKNCQSGIMRGVARNNSGSYTPICWEYQAPTEKPEWAIPTSITLNDLTNKIELQYSPLNRPRCPDMTITTLSGKSWNLPNFYSFSTLDLQDLFPAKTAGTPLASQCEKVIDFSKGTLNNGLIPQTLVNDSSVNKKPGSCPDKNLYVLNHDGSCQTNFIPSNIPDRAPAQAGL